MQFSYKILVVDDDSLMRELSVSVDGGGIFRSLVSLPHPCRRGVHLRDSARVGAVLFPRDLACRRDGGDIGKCRRKQFRFELRLVQTESVLRIVGVRDRRHA